MGENFEADLAHLRKLLNAGAFDDVLTHTDSLLSAYPGIAQLHVLRGSALLGLKNPDGARESFDGALALEPDNGAALLNLGLALEYLRRPNEALWAYARAQGLKGVAHQASRAIARILLAAGEADAPGPAVIRNGKPHKALNARAMMRTHPASCVFHEDALHVSQQTPIRQIPSGENISRAFDGLPGYLFELADAECVSSNLVFHGDTFIDANITYSSLQLMQHVRRSRLRLEAVDQSRTLNIVIEEPSKRVERQEPIGLLHTSSNYAAWLLGELPRLYFYAKSQRPLKVLLQGNVRPFHMESLRLLGIAEEDIAFADTDTLIAAKTLYFAPPTFVQGTFSFSALHFLRERFLSRNGNAHQRGRAVYLSRSKLGSAADRPLVNEPQLEAFLVERGVEVLHPQLMTVEDQVAALASADRVIAPFGAALANLLFSREGTKVCILDTKRSPEFIHLCQWLGLPAYLIEVSREAVREDIRLSQKFDFRASLDDVRKFLDLTD